MNFIYDTVITWEKTYMDECINILQKLCDDHIQEKSDFQTLVNQNLFQIEKINSYLKSLFENSKSLPSKRVINFCNFSVDFYRFFNEIIIKFIEKGYILIVVSEFL